MGFSSKNIGVSSHSLLHGIFLTRGSNPGLHNADRFEPLYHLSHQGRPETYLAGTVFLDILASRTMTSAFLFQLLSLCHFLTATQPDKYRACVCALIFKTVCFKHSQHNIDCHWLQPLCQFSRGLPQQITIILITSNNKNVLSHSSRGQISKIKVLARPCSLPRLKGSISLCLSQLLVDPGIFGLQLYSSNQCLHPHMALFSLLSYFVLFYSILFNVRHCLHLFFFFLDHATWHVGLYFFDRGLNPHPLHQKPGVLTTGPPRKSLLGTVMRTLTISFRTHPDNTEWSYLVILDYNCKDSFLTRFQCGHIFGGIRFSP